MGFRLEGLYARSIPKLRYNEAKAAYEVDEETEHGNREGGWLFLFVDLVLVALITKTASALMQCEISPHTLTFQAVMFVTMFITRLHFDDYTNRFYTNDAFHRLLYFVYFMGFFIMTLNVNVANSNHVRSDALCKANLYGIGFGVGFLASRFSLVVLYLSVMMEDKRAFEQFFNGIARTILAMFFVLVFMWYEQAQMSNVSVRWSIFAVCSSSTFRTPAPLLFTRSLTPTIRHPPPLLAGRQGRLHARVSHVLLSRGVLCGVGRYDVAPHRAGV